MHSLIIVNINQQYYTTIMEIMDKKSVTDALKALKPALFARGRLHRLTRGIRLRRKNKIPLWVFGVLG